MSKTILDVTVAECEARNRLAPATPCSHNVPLQRDPLGDHSANFCPTCRAAEAERERCAKIADGYGAEMDTSIANIGEMSAACEIAARIRRGE